MHFICTRLLGSLDLSSSSLYYLKLEAELWKRWKLYFLEAGLSDLNHVNNLWTKTWSCLCNALIKALVLVFLKWHRWCVTIIFIFISFNSKNLLSTMQSYIILIAKFKKSLSSRAYSQIFRA